MKITVIQKHEMRKAKRRATSMLKENNETRRKQGTPVFKMVAIPEVSYWSTYIFPRNPEQDENL
jgi:hypothetical protein